MIQRKSKRVTEYWGERCEEYEPICACCIAWCLLDETGKPPSYRAVADRVDANRKAAARKGGTGDE